MDEEEYDFLVRAFNKYDIDKTGTFSHEEFKKFIVQLSKHIAELSDISDESIEAAFRYIDIDSAGTSGFKEIYNWWLSPLRFNILSGPISKLIIKAHRLFQTFSTQKNKLTYKDFEDMLTELSLPHTDYTFDSLDNDSDGLLGFREFVNWLEWF